MSSQMGFPPIPARHLFGEDITRTARPGPLPGQMQADLLLYKTPDCYWGATPFLNALLYLDF